MCIKKKILKFIFQLYLIFLIICANTYAQNTLNVFQELIENCVKEIKNQHPNIDWGSNNPINLIVDSGWHKEKDHARSTAIAGLQIEAALLSGKLMLNYSMQSSVEEIISSNSYTINDLFKNRISIEDKTIEVTFDEFIDERILEKDGLYNCIKAVKIWRHNIRTDDELRTILSGFQIPHLSHLEQTCDNLFEYYDSHVVELFLYDQSSGLKEMLDVLFLGYPHFSVNNSFYIYTVKSYDPGIINRLTDNLNTTSHEIINIKNRRKLQYEIFIKDDNYKPVLLKLKYLLNRANTLNENLDDLLNRNDIMSLNTFDEKSHKIQAIQIENPQIFSNDSADDDSEAFLFVLDHLPITPVFSEILANFLTIFGIRNTSTKNYLGSEEFMKIISAYKEKFPSGYKDWAILSGFESYMRAVNNLKTLKDQPAHLNYEIAKNTYNELMSISNQKLFKFNLEYYTKIALAKYYIEKYD